MLYVIAKNDFLRKQEPKAIGGTFFNPYQVAKDFPTRADTVKKRSAKIKIKLIYLFVVTLNI